MRFGRLSTLGLLGAALGVVPASAWFPHGTPSSPPAPPVISSISSGTPSTNSATITWDTDTASTTRVNYGLTTGYGSQCNNASLVTSHSCFISGLVASTLYHFDVASTDAYSQTTTSGDNNFTTSGSLVATNWTRMALGGGGNVSGIDINPTSGTRFLRSDIGGAYLWGNDTAWHNVVTQASMPAANFGLFPSSGGSQVWVGVAGVIEVALATDNPTVGYLYAGGCPSFNSCTTNQHNVYYSANLDPAHPDSVTWCNSTSGWGAKNDINSENLAITKSDPGQFMAADPYNSDHVYVGTPNYGLFETFNGSACPGTWTAVSTATIPLSTRSNTPGYAIAFDPTGGTTTRSGHTVAANAYVFSSDSAHAGTNAGVYVTTDGGATFTRKPGGPTTLQHMHVSADLSHGGGNLWAVDQSNSVNSAVFEYTGGAWTAFLTTSVKGNDVAINPNNGDHILVFGGAAYATSNGSLAPGSISWGSGFLAGTGVIYSGATAAIMPGSSEGDAAWQSTIAVQVGTLGGRTIAADPLATDGFVASAGQGTWKFQWASGFASSYYLVAMTKGIDGLVNGRIEVGSAQTPTIGADDESGCRYSIATAASTPSGCIAMSQFWDTNNGLSQVQDLSLAPGTNFMAAKIDPNGVAGAIDYSGYSTNGFAATGGSYWTGTPGGYNTADYRPFNVWNAVVAGSGGGISSGTGGVVRVALTSAAGLKIFAPGDTFGSKSIVCAMGVANGVGSSSSFGNEQCYPISAVNTSGGNYIELFGSTFASNQTNVNNWLFWVPAMALSPQFGDLTVTNVDSDAGSVRVTVAALDHWAGNNYPVHISGVTMSGVGTPTTVNGDWVVTATSFSVVHAAVNAGGSTYTGASGTMTWSGTGCSINPVFNVTASGGVITSVTSIATAGLCTVAPGNSATTWTPGGGLSAGDNKASFTMIDVGLFDLKDSTFGSDTYSTGGTVRSESQTGGGIAASTASAITQVGGNINNFPMCTADAGVSWTPVVMGNNGELAVATTITNGPLSAGASSVTTAANLTSGGVYRLHLTSGRYLYVTATGSAGTYTISPVIPPGDGVTADTNVYTGTGWSSATFDFTHPLAADQVTANTFYGVNANAGLLRWTVSGGVCTAATQIAIKNNSTWTSGNGSWTTLRAVPGHAGHLFWTTGQQGGAVANHPASNGLWRICNAGGAANTGTWVQVPGFFEPTSVGFGAAGPGKSYPAEYVVGWKGATQSTATYGVWRSIDDPNNGASGSCDVATQTWVNIATSSNNAPGGFPTKIGNGGGFVDVAGDPFTYGPVYLSNINGGAFYAVVLP